MGSKNDGFDFRTRGRPCDADTIEPRMHQGFGRERGRQTQDLFGGCICNSTKGLLTSKLSEKFSHTETETMSSTSELNNSIIIIQTRLMSCTQCRSFWYQEGKAGFNARVRDAAVNKEFQSNNGCNFILLCHLYCSYRPPQNLKVKHKPRAKKLKGIKTSGDTFILKRKSRGKKPQYLSFFHTITKWYVLPFFE